MSTAPFKPKNIGEIAIRCANLEAMTEFYCRILGLEVFGGSPASGVVFLKLGVGYGGHETVIGLFRHNAGRADIHPRSAEPPETGARSSLHHLALTVDAADQPAIERWLAENDVPFKVQLFEWVGWRGIFFSDPEGNTVELVAAHPDWKRAPEDA